MTKPVRHRFRPHDVAACVQARRYAAAIALLAVAACAQAPAVPEDAQTGCAMLDFVFSKPTFHLVSKSHVDLRSTPLQVLLSRQARPLSEPIPHPAALAHAGGASPPGADAPTAKAAEPQRGEVTAGWPWFFTLAKNLDCAWPVDFEPRDIATLKLRLHVRIRQDGHVESTEVISEHGDPAHLLPAFRATAMATIRRALPLPETDGFLDRVGDDGLDVDFELRGFASNLRAAVAPRRGRGSAPRRRAPHRAL